MLVALVGLILPALAGAYPAEVPRTGQTTCYDAAGTVIGCTETGQDGARLAGVAWPVPHFVDNGDGAVLDSLTGLVWAKNANLLGTVDADNDTDDTPNDGRVTWQHALHYIKKLNRLNYLGRNDWRLPNVNELESLVNAGVYNPALPTHPFTQVQSYVYWSSTTYAFFNTYSAWVMYMDDGYVYYGDKEYYCYVWPVRAGKCGLDNSVICLPKTGHTTCYDTAGTVIGCAGTGQDGDIQAGVDWPSQQFVDNGDGTVTDKLTGLEWTKDANTAGTGKTWQQALDFVKTLNTGGHRDWRLPNRRELRSLNFSQTHPFTNLQLVFYYWSSTSCANKTNYAWLKLLFDGSILYYDKSQRGFVWPVRAGQAGISGKPCPAKKLLGEDNPQLEILRDFRDSKLANSVMGHRIINIYYNNADSIDAALERSPALQAAARRVLEVIAPMVGKN